MGSSGSSTPAKASKASSSTNQEQPPATTPSPAGPVFPEWPPFQAYSPIAHPGFFTSPVASGAHPYLWGAQPIMPPYGTPSPYVMYPPGALYAHSSMPHGTHPYGPYQILPQNGNGDPSGTAGGAETDGKSSEGKDKSPLKKSRESLGSLNMITGNNSGEHGKTIGAPVNGSFSQSGETGSESSSDGSATNSQNDSVPKGSCEIAPGDTLDSQNGVTCTSSQASLSLSMPLVPIPTDSLPGPTTNLKIGMDYWATSSPANPSTQGKLPAEVSGAVIPSEQWDERELKRQKRKQSNRESARRSRLRKQAECEELAQRAEALKEENASLRAEVNRIRKEYEELLSKNASLKEKMGETLQETDDTADKKPHNSEDVDQKLE